VFVFEVLEMRQEEVQLDLDHLGRPAHGLLKVLQLGLVKQLRHRHGCGHEAASGPALERVPVERSLLPGEHLREQVAKLEAGGDELLDEVPGGLHHRVDRAAGLLRSMPVRQLDGALARAAQA
jgi:hypothetical protein